MKSSHPRMHRVLACAAMTGLLLLILPAASAQQPPAPGYRPTVTIDGASHPEQVPDWILWREMFRAAVLLAEKAPDAGRDVWVNRLHLSPRQMNHLIALGREFQDEEGQMMRDVKQIAGGSNGVPSESVKARLRQLQAENEIRISAYRDRLAEAIGWESMQKLQSFARLHIAPGVRIGELVPADRK